VIITVGGGPARWWRVTPARKAGAEVRLFEAHREMGGRACSSSGPFVTNLGPHALYCDGSWWAWLAEREPLPPVAKPSLTGVRFRHSQKAHRMPPLAIAAKAESLRRSTSSSRAGRRSAAAPSSRRSWLPRLRRRLSRRRHGRLLLGALRGRFQQRDRGQPRCHLCTRLAADPRLPWSQVTRPEGGKKHLAGGVRDEKP
jgi:protoporphyrinogen oxidase